MRVLRPVRLATSFAPRLLTGAEARPHGDEPAARRWDAFERAHKAQADGRARHVQKIEIIMVDRRTGEDMRQPLAMNWHVSTPHHCAMHVGGADARFSPLCWDVNRDAPVSMHRPLDEATRLRLLRHDERSEKYASAVNLAFWHGCSFILGHMMRACLHRRHEVAVHRHSTTEPSAGRFECEFWASGLDDWRPTRAELLALNVSCVRRLRRRNYAVEPLWLRRADAEVMFDGDESRLARLDAVQSETDTGEQFVLVYRVGGHVDLCDEPSVPLLASTDHVQRFAVASIGRVDAGTGGRSLYRAAGVALPLGQRVDPPLFRLLTAEAQTAAAAEARGDSTLVVESESAGAS